MNAYPDRVRAFYLWQDVEKISHLAIYIYDAL